MKTFRAAYIPDDGSSTGGGVLLTEPKHALLDDAAFIKTALLTLAENNKNISAIGQAENAEEDICIGEWKE